MDQPREELNRFLVEVFHQVLKTEELALSRAKGELSLRELHLIEEVCRAADLGLDNRATAIAAAQRVTAGTLTTAVSLLERKGYLERRRDEHDKRVVRILPTEKARQANREHERFHEEMVDYILNSLSQEEAQVFVRTLSRVSGFFQEKTATASRGAEQSAPSAAMEQTREHNETL